MPEFFWNLLRAPFVSKGIAAGDWTGCIEFPGKSVAGERLW